MQYNNSDNYVGENSINITFPQNITDTNGQNLTTETTELQIDGSAGSVNLVVVLGVAGGILFAIFVVIAFLAIKKHFNRNKQKNLNFHLNGQKGQLQEQCPSRQQVYQPKQNKRKKDNLKKNINEIKFIEQITSTINIQSHQKYYPIFKLTDIFQKEGKYVQKKRIQHFRQENIQHEEDCVICLYPMTKQCELMITYCGHIFHASCLTNWILKSDRCPDCQIIQFSQDCKKENYNRILRKSSLRKLRSKDLIQTIMSQHRQINKQRKVVKEQEFRQKGFKEYYF